MLRRPFRNFKKVSCQNSRNEYLRLMRFLTVVIKVILNSEKHPMCKISKIARISLTLLGSSIREKTVSSQDRLRAKPSQKLAALLRRNLVTIRVKEYSLQ
jgi:hypothetical protein